MSPTFPHSNMISAEPSQGFLYFSYDGKVLTGAIPTNGRGLAVVPHPSGGVSLSFAGDHTSLRSADDIGGGPSSVPVSFTPAALEAAGIWTPSPPPLAFPPAGSFGAPVAFDSTLPVSAAGLCCSSECIRCPSESVRCSSESVCCSSDSVHVMDSH